MENEKNEIMNVEEINNEVEFYEPEYEGCGILSKIVGGALVSGLVGGAIYLFKHKEELKTKKYEKQAAALRKAGYIVELADTDSSSDDDVETNVVEESDEK